MKEYDKKLHNYNKKVGILGIIDAYEHGYKTLRDIAEYLDVTEEFLSESVVFYQEKYGLYTTVDNYIVYLIPFLTVGKQV